MYTLSTVRDYCKCLLLLDMTQIRSSSNVCRYSICDLEKVEFKCFEVLFERTEPLFDDRRKNGNRTFLLY